MFLCIEILGESAVHRFLVQAGWSGKVYPFYYNRRTNSHLRAYRTLEEYYAERVDLHKAANVWPLVANLLPQERIDPQAFTDEGGRNGAAVDKPETAKKQGTEQVTTALKPKGAGCH